VLLLLGGAPQAWAQEGARAASPSLDAPPPWKLRFGALVDVGAPDGIGVAAVVRPLRWLRLNAGATTNTIGLGLRGGASLMPFELFISPTLDFDVGHYFNADYGKLLTRMGGTPGSASSLIGSVGYNYASAGFGLELSPWRSVSLSLRFGLGYWSIQVNDVQSFIRESTNDPNISASPRALRFTSPSVKLGVLIYFN
jgi:hypothetical protein